jgi:hypothetical protein
VRARVVRQTSCGRPLPTPPRQTPFQLSHITEVQHKAVTASAAARPSLLALLGGGDFLVALGGCCAGLRGMSPAERLAWFDQESKVVEMVHNFGRGLGALEGDESITVGANSTYFHNLWEIELLAAELPQGGSPGGGQRPNPPPAYLKLMTTPKELINARLCHSFACVQ